MTRGLRCYFRGQSVRGRFGRVGYLEDRRPGGRYRGRGPWVSISVTWLPDTIATPSSPHRFPTFSPSPLFLVLFLPSSFPSFSSSSSVHPSEAGLTPNVPFMNAVKRLSFSRWQTRCLLPSDPGTGLRVRVTHLHPHRLLFRLLDRSLGIIHPHPHENPRAPPSTRPYLRSSPPPLTPNSDRSYDSCDESTDD